MERNRLIVGYREAGFTIAEIKFILEQEHGFTISERQLKRIMKGCGLSKRKYCSPSEIVNFIQEQLSGSGQLHGYRVLYYKCLYEGLRVRMEDVRLALGILDPYRVAVRRARRLQRRAYFANGPNFVWNLDGYDKLKPYGLCIHGCICGYSRKIIWLNVHNTNNNPRLIGGYFIEAVKKYEGVPRQIRGDLVTENVKIRDIQRYLRRNHNDTQASHPYIEGSSTTNQRIESWWGFLRQECAQFWMNIFENLVDTGEFCGDFVDKNVVQFCFMAVLQDELDKLAGVWNSPTIRPSRNPRVPGGRPSQMYHMPSLWGAEEHMCSALEEDVEPCMPECEFRSPVPCDADIYQLCVQLMQDNNGHEYPKNGSEAVILYRFLRNEIRNIL